MKHWRPCELCAGEAAVYCDSDAAFLCWPCDAAVHGANFLVARHVRRAACSACRSFDDGSPLVSGAGSHAPARALLICRSCAPEQPEAEAEHESCPPSPTHSASSSSCLSTSESASAASPCIKSAAKRRRQRAQLAERAESVLFWWCGRMGLRSGAQCAAVAARAIAACGGAVASLPPRVALAAALWSAIKLCEEDGAGPAVLRRLEACSGVPARLITVAQSRIVRPSGRVRVQVLQEGWAECP